MITARKSCYQAVVWLRHSPNIYNTNDAILIKIDTNYNLFYKNLVSFKFRVNHKIIFFDKNMFLMLILGYVRLSKV